MNVYVYAYEVLTGGDEMLMAQEKRPEVDFYARSTVKRALEQNKDPNSDRMRMMRLRLCLLHFYSSSLYLL